MKLYLMRHADAVTHADDFTRHLSDLGLAEVNAVLQKLPQSLDIKTILHSPAARTTETAQLVAKHFGIQSIRPENYLSIDHEDVNQCLIDVEMSEDTVLLVSHFPVLNNIFE